MMQKKMTPEQAAALARRDRVRLIVMSVLAVLVLGAYLLTTSKASQKADEERAALSSGTAPDEAITDIAVPEFSHTALLSEIHDATPTEQELLSSEPLAAVFDYARLLTPDSMRALGITELDAATQSAIEASPATERLKPLRVRGSVVTARRRPRDGAGASRSGDDWIGTLQTLDGRFAHFLVAAAPKRADGERRVELGDFLRVDGLFHSIYRTSIDVDGTAAATGAPLIVGLRLEPTDLPMTPELAEQAPALADVIDDSLSEIHENREFREAFWQLMGRAKLLGPEVNWDEVPELNSDLLTSIHKNGEAFRGQPFKVPVSVNVDTYSIQVGDNPLRLDRQTEGWISNSTWKGSVKTIKWIGPFTRQDMLRRTLMNDDRRYMTARGYFFRNHGFENNLGQPARAPIFVMESVEVFRPEEDKAIVWFKWGVVGITVLLTAVVALLLRADKRKSKALYEDMVRRKRARREREAAPTA